MGAAHRSVDTSVTHDLVRCLEVTRRQPSALLSETEQPDGLVVELDGLVDDEPALPLGDAGTGIGFGCAHAGKVSRVPLRGEKGYPQSGTVDSPG